MGDAKRLLEENHRLKNERQELSSVLGEEKEMVKYLHGVIKNYEHLLRSNSKRQDQYRPENTTDHDTVLTTSHIKPKLQASIPHEVKKEGLPKMNSKEKDVDSWRRSLEGRHDMHGLQTVEREVIHHAHNKNHLSVHDDICLEDLEYLSISSTDESTEDFALTPEMERRRFNERTHVKESQLTAETSRTLPGKSRDDKPLDHNHRVNNTGQHSKTNTKKTIYDKESIKKNNNVTNTKPSSISNRDIPTSFDTELDELNKELDAIASRLNKYEKSVNRSEKQLSKMEHRMEYLESFALGEESEYL